jgi:hypothetical protein
VYRGDPDTLGTGMDAKGVGLNSETQRVDDQAALDAALKDGWRLTREHDKPAHDKLAPAPQAKK